MMFGPGLAHLALVPHVFGGLGMVMPMMSMWLIPLLLIVWALTASSHKQAVPSGCGPAQPVTYDPAIDIVRERYARGEIDRTQYEQLVAGLIGRS